MDPDKLARKIETAHKKRRQKPDPDYAEPTTNFSGSAACRRLQKSKFHKGGYVSSHSQAVSYLLRSHKTASTTSNTRWATTCGAMPCGRRCQKIKDNGNCPDPACLGNDVDLVAQTAQGFQATRNGISA